MMSSSASTSSAIGSSDSLDINSSGLTPESILVYKSMNDCFVSSSNLLVHTSTAFSLFLKIGFESEIEMSDRTEIEWKNEQ